MVILADFDENYNNPESAVDLFKAHQAQVNSIWVVET